MLITLRPFLVLLAATTALAAEPLVITETELTFSANGHALPVPLIKAHIYNTDGLLMVDTGSSHNVVTRAFADAQHLDRSAAPEGRDHVGANVSTDLAAPGYWQIGAVTRTLRDGVVVPAPAAFAPLGIVGFLSPQNFFDRGFVILDFSAGRMIILGESTAEALQAWLHQRYPAAQALSLPRAAGPDARKLYVQARLADHDPVIAELDTGGSITEFDEALLPTSAPAASPTSSMTVNGKKTSARTVDGQIVSLANHNFGPMWIKARAPQAGFAALIGMDLLRHTVLVIPISPKDPLQLLVK